MKEKDPVKMEDTTGSLRLTCLNRSIKNLELYMMRVHIHGQWITTACRKTGEVRHMLTPHSQALLDGCAKLLENLKKEREMKLNLAGADGLSEIIGLRTESQPAFLRESKKETNG